MHCARTQAVLSSYRKSYHAGCLHVKVRRVVRGQRKRKPIAWLLFAFQGIYNNLLNLRRGERFDILAVAFNS